MANIQLPTGKTIQISLYDFLFRIQDDEVDLFFQSCIADDLGTFLDDPFANRSNSWGKLEFEETTPIPEELDLDENELDLDND